MDTADSRSTKSFKAKSFFFVFELQYLLTFSWYLATLKCVESLRSSRRSQFNVKPSSDLCESKSLSLADSALISTGRTASVPYASLNGDSPIEARGVVR